MNNNDYVVILLFCLVLTQCGTENVRITNLPVCNNEIATNTS